MKAKEIIKNVCIYLNKDEILKSSTFTQNGSTIGDIAQGELDLMVDCLNYVVEEIASEYLPILKQKQVQLQNHKIAINSIDENIQDIISVKNKFDKPLKYSIIDGQIVCLANDVVVVYSVYPTTIISLEDDVDFFNGTLSARVIAFGVASEFCFMQMLTTQASLWEVRYKNALMVDVRKKGSLHLKGRCWF